MQHLLSGFDCYPLFAGAVVHFHSLLQLEPVKKPDVVLQESGPVAWYRIQRLSIVS
jgi:hypothetical protein